MKTQPKPQPRGVQKPCRILVVDRDVQVAELVSRILGSELCQIESEDSVENLIKTVREESFFDAILIDLFDPVERVFRLIPTLKEMAPRTEIIIVSQLAEVDLWVESIQRGAFDYLPKPLDSNEVRRILQNALEKNKAISHSL